MTFEKEQAYDNFIDMIKKSWTYARLTEDERKQFDEAFSLTYECVRKSLRGTYMQRWSYLQALYHSFLYGIGYTPCKPWRE